MTELIVNFMLHVLIFYHIKKMCEIKLLIRQGPREGVNEGSSG